MKAEAKAKSKAKSKPFAAQFISPPKKDIARNNDDKSDVANIDMTSVRADDDEFKYEAKAESIQTAYDTPLPQDEYCYSEADDDFDLPLECRSAITPQKPTAIRRREEPPVNDPNQEADILDIQDETTHPLTITSTEYPPLSEAILCDDDMSIVSYTSSIIAARARITGASASGVTGANAGGVTGANAGGASSSSSSEDDILEVD